MLRRLPLLAALILWLPGMLMAQPFGTLRGKVLDKDGNPVMGATIRIVGTKRGAISKADGSFLIAGITPDTYEVTVTAVFYKPVSTEITVIADTAVEMKAVFPEKRVVKIPRWCRRGDPFKPERMGTTHTISAEALDRSARPTLFGGGY